MAPPQNLEAEQSVLGAVLLSDTSLPALIIDERLSAGRLLPREPRAHLPGDARPAHAGRAGSTRSRSSSTSSRPVTWRRSAAPPRSSCSPGSVPGGRQPAPVRARSCARTRCCGASCNAAYEIQAQVHGHEALPRDLVDMAERAHPRGRPRGLAQGLPLDRAAAGLRARQAPEALARGQSAHGHAVRVRGPGQHHRRLPAGQPDHPGRQAVDGQVPGGRNADPRPVDGCAQHASTSSSPG